MNRSREANTSLSGRRTGPRWVVGIAALLLTSVALIQAQTTTLPSPDALLELLEVLHQNGAVSQQQYDGLKARMGVAAPTHETMEQTSDAQTEQKPTPSVNPKIITMMDKGIGIHVGAVDVTVSGEVNGFYDHDRVDKSPSAALIGGGLRQHRRHRFLCGAQWPAAGELLHRDCDPSDGLRCWRHAGFLSRPQ